MNINKKLSFYNNHTITDSMIMDHVGIVTYSQLQYKFPNFFDFYKECEGLHIPKEGHLPSVINLSICNDPYQIKRDLILSYCGEEFINPKHEILAHSSSKPNYPLLEKEDNTYLWIIICTFIIVLIFIALGIIYHLDKYNRL